MSTIKTRYIPALRTAHILNVHQTDLYRERERDTCNNGFCTSSDEDENEEIQTERRGYNFRTRTPAQRNYFYYCSYLFDI